MPAVFANDDEERMYNESQAESLQARLDSAIGALREIQANAKFFRLDNTELHPSHSDLFKQIEDRATAELKAQDVE